MKKPKIICTVRDVHTTATILRTTEDSIYLKCDTCGEEWSSEIGFYADLFRGKPKK